MVTETQYCSECVAKGMGRPLTALEALHHTDLNPGHHLVSVEQLEAETQKETHVPSK